MSKMGEKKGQVMLTRQIIYIILALACIILLFYAFDKGTGLLFGSQENLLAENWLEDLTKTMEFLEAGEDSYYPLLAPSGWYLISFSQQDEKKPSDRSCFGACLCLCSKKDISCKRGFCKTLSKDLKYLEDEKTLQVPVGLDLKLNGIFSINRSGRILPSVLKPSQNLDPEPVELSENRGTKLDNFNVILKEKGYLEIIEKKVEEYGIPIALMKGIMYQESRGVSLSVGPCGEGGLYQHMPGTAEASGISPIFEDASFTSCAGTAPRAYASRLKEAIKGKTLIEAKDIDGRFDPKKSIEGGAKHLKSLKNSFGDNVPAIIAAYNRGAKGLQDDCPELDVPVCSNLHVGAKSYYITVWAYYKFFEGQEKGSTI